MGTPSDKAVRKFAVGGPESHKGGETGLGVGRGSKRGVEKT